MGAYASQPEVISLGETLVDLVPTDTRPDWQFAPRAGGAPGNVAAALARLGHHVALVSRVGTDPMGALVLAALQSAGVDLRWIQLDRFRPTTMAIVSPPGVPAGFTIYMRGSASAQITVHALPFDAVDNARILHVGTLSMMTGTSRVATRAAIERARAAGVLVSLDVNFRSTAWHTKGAMVAAAIELIGHADIVKLTVDEKATLGVEGREALSDGPQVVLITDAGREARITVGGFTASRMPPGVEVVDPTGAGDAFLAEFLHLLIIESKAGKKLCDFTDEFWTDALVRSLAAGTDVVARRGAGTENPTRDQVMENLRQIQADRRGSMGEPR